MLPTDVAVEHASVPTRKVPAVTSITKLRPTYTKPGSPFELAVKEVDVAKEATRELEPAKFRTGVTLWKCY